jgi:hypothetical protein
VLNTPCWVCRGRVSECHQLPQRSSTLSLSLFSLCVCVCVCVWLMPTRRVCLARQVSEQGEGVSYMKYDVKEGVDNSQYALFHNMEEVEYKANWARFWVDMGTSDEISLDILINSLLQMSREYVGIKSCVIGGINEDWKEDTERKVHPPLAPVTWPVAGWSVR